MKKIYFFFVGFLLISGLMAQTANQAIKDQLKGAVLKPYSSVKISGIKDYLAKFRSKETGIFIPDQMILKNLVLKQKLDSVVYQAYDTLNFVWKPSDVEKFTYDNNGRNTSNTSYTWNDQLNRMVPDMKFEYNYDANSYLSALHYYEWDTIASVPQWNEFYKFLYSYGSNGLLNENTSYYWDEDAMALVASTKMVYSYDSQNNPVSETGYMWDTDLNNWVLFSKTENTYDANNNMTKSEYSINMGGEVWMLYYKYEYTYDSQGRMLTSIHSSLDYFSYTLVYANRDVYTYDSNGDNTQIIISDWVNNAWVNSGKEENTYDASHRLLTYKEYVWDSKSSSWLPYQSEENTYDANGNIILSVYNTHDEAANWLLESKAEVTYNNSYNYNDLLFPYIYNDIFFDMFSNMLTGYSEYLWKNGQWVPDSKVTFYYSGINLNSANIFTDGIIRIYPNPVTDVLTIYTGSNIQQEVSLLSLDGNQILNKQFNNQLTLSVKGLPSGIYFVKIKSPDKADYLKKIIVQ